MKIKGFLNDKNIYNISVKKFKTISRENNI
jgi:hypothetical protein